MISVLFFTVLMLLLMEKKLNFQFSAFLSYKINEINLVICETIHDIIRFNPLNNLQYVSIFRTMLSQIKISRPQ